jgi:hypothetical protein
MTAILASGLIFAITVSAWYDSSVVVPETQTFTRVMLRILETGPETLFLAVKRFLWYFHKAPPVGR